MYKTLFIIVCCVCAGCRVTNQTQALFDDLRDTKELCVAIDSSKLLEVDNEILVWKLFFPSIYKVPIDYGIYKRYRDPNTIKLLSARKNEHQNDKIISSYSFLEKHPFLKIRKNNILTENIRYFPPNAKNPNSETRVNHYLLTDNDVFPLGGDFRDFIYFDWELTAENAEKLLADKDVGLDYTMSWSINYYTDREIESVSAYQIHYQLVPREKYLAIQNEIEKSRPQCTRKKVDGRTTLPEPYVDKEKKYYHKEYVFFYQNSFWRMVVKMGNGFFMARKELLIQGSQFEWKPGEMEERMELYGSSAFSVEPYRVEKDRIPADVSEFEDYIIELFKKYDVVLDDKLKNSN